MLPRKEDTVRSGRSRLLAIALSIVLVVLMVQSVHPNAARAAAFCDAGEAPQFRFGFAHLKTLLGDTMGEPLECEHVSEPSTGDTVQQTTTGLAYYRAWSNTPTFTDGWNHWAWTAAGLVEWGGTTADPPPPPGSATQSIDGYAPILSPSQLTTTYGGAVVGINTSSGCGSGFFVTSDGYMVTASHVVAGHSTVSLVFSDGRTAVAAVVASDPGVDLALVRMPAASGSVGYVKFGSSASLPLASNITILGYPLCLQSLTVTRGIFSSRIYDGAFEYLQTDAAVNPGNSGGAAFSDRGAIVGVPVFKWIQAGVESTGFLVPSDRVRTVVDDWITRHRAGVLAPPVQATPVPAPTSTPRPQPTAMPRPSASAGSLIQSVGIARDGDCISGWDSGVLWLGELPGNPLPVRFCIVYVLDWWPQGWTQYTRWYWPSGMVDNTTDGVFCTSSDCRGGYMKDTLNNPNRYSRYPGTLYIDLFVNGSYVRTDSFVVR